MTAVVMIEAVVIALLCVLVVGLLRSHAEILRALHDLGVNLEEGTDDDQTFRVRESARRRAAVVDVTTDHGIVEAQREVADPATLGAARDIAGETPDGEAAVVAVVGAPRPTLLAFLSSGCLTCQDFWEAFDRGVALELDGREVRVVAVTKGADAESPGAIAALAGPGFTTVMSNEAYDDYGVPVSPYFVLVDAHGADIVGEGAAASWTQLASLLDRAVGDRAAALGTGRRTRREVFSGGARGRSAGPERDPAARS